MEDEVRDRLLERLDERTLNICKTLENINLHLVTIDKELKGHQGKIGILNGKMWGIITILGISASGSGVYALTRFL